MNKFINTNYSTNVSVLRYLLFTLYISSAEILWIDLMNNDATMGNWYSNVEIMMMDSDSGCADRTGPCWKFCPGDAYINTTLSTKGYNDVKLTFDVDPHAMTYSSSFCRFSYSIDNGADWSPFYQINGGDIHITNHTEAFGNATWDKIAVGIKIEVIGGSDSCCFIANFMLTGNALDLSTFIPLHSSATDNTNTNTESESTTPDELDHKDSNKENGNAQILQYIIAASVLLNVLFIGLCVGFIIGIRRRRNEVERQLTINTATVQYNAKPAAILSASVSVSPAVHEIDEKDGADEKAYALEGCGNQLQEEEGAYDDDVNNLNETARSVDHNNPNVQKDEFIIDGDEEEPQESTNFTYTARGKKNISPPGLITA